MNGARSFAGGPTAASNAVALATGLATKPNLWSTTAIKTTTYTAAPWELVRCDSSSGSFTVTLPAANVAGQQVAVKLLATSGTNTVTVSRAGSDTINNAATSITLTLTDEAVVFTSNGAGVWTVTEGRVTLTSLDARFAAVATASQIPADRGYLAWTYPPAVAVAGSVIGTAGQLWLSRVRRVPAGSVTNISLVLSVVGNTLTTGQCFAALFTAAGAKIDVTADQAANWTTGTGEKKMALAGGAYTHTGGDLYVGFWFNGTTGPTFQRTGATAAMLNVGLVAPNFDTAVANTGLTTTAPNPFTTQTSASVHFWAALS